MSAIKVGDDVRCITKGEWCDGIIGQVVYLYGDDMMDVRTSQGKTLLCMSYEIERLKPRTPSLAVTLSLYPQEKTILRHLEKGKTISPMKALVVYGISRLASCIHRIRNAGYNIERTMHEDERGHRYAEYRLA